MDLNSFENKIEFNCNLVLKTDSEFWEIRNKGIVALRNLFAQLENTPNANEYATANIFRMLKDPVKLMVSQTRVLVILF